MKKADWIFALGAIVVVVFFIGLSLTGRTPPPMPSTAAHETAETRQDCLVCHDPGLTGSVNPIPSDHPLAWKDEKFNCTSCHKPGK